MTFRSTLLTTALLLTACSDDPDNAVAPGPKAQHPLSITVTGAGAGHVVSTPAGIDTCARTSGTCSAPFDEGAVVTLAAVPAPGYLFNGWTGGCSGASACAVTISAAAEVRASFVPVPFVCSHIIGSGPGALLNHAVWTALTDGTQAMPMTSAELTSSGGGWWSRDGERLLHLSAPRTSQSGAGAGVPNLTLTTPDGFSRPVTKFVKAWVFENAWSSEGRILFVSTASPDGSDVNGAQSNLWVVNPDGSGRTALTNLLGPGVEANFSSSATHAFYLSRRGLQEFEKDMAAAPNIWKVPLSGGQSLPLTTFTKGGLLGAPEVSPDGTQVAFMAYLPLDTSAEKPSMNIWLMNADGSNLRPLTRLLKSAMNHTARIHWMPDGTRILFSSDSHPLQPVDPETLEVSNLFSADVATGAVTPFTRLTSTGAAHAWVSPDGSRVFYQSYGNLEGADVSGAAFNVWSADRDGAVHVPLTRELVDDCYSVRQRVNIYQ